jgi:hypothetical protein
MLPQGKTGQKAANAAKAGTPRAAENGGTAEAGDPGISGMVGTNGPSPSDPVNKDQTASVPAEDGGAAETGGPAISEPVTKEPGGQGRAHSRRLERLKPVDRLRQRRVC